VSNKPVDYASAYAALEKLGKLLTPLQPHQERVKQRIQNQPGLVVAHGLGTGKTLASIASADALDMPTTVVVPAALQANYLKELQAHRAEGADNFNVTSLQKATRSQSLPDLKDQLLIVDEAHKLREPATKAHQYFKKLNPAKRMYLTASPVYNHPADLASLVNLAAGSKVLPNTRNDFESTFTKMEKIRPGFWGRLRGVKPGERQVLQNIPQLKETLHKWVDYHENKDTGDFPTSSEKIIHVPMSEKQQEVQDALLDKAPPWVRYKIKNNLPPSKQEKQLINSFLTTQRQLASSPQAFSHGMTIEEAVKHSPKLQLAVKSLLDRMKENPNHKAVVYSNYLESGLNPYKHLLEQNKVPYGMFTGAMKKPEREQLVRDYNDNKIKALLLSTAGAEGLDLKGTRQIQLLDPHFNEEKMRQIIGRGVRYKSHSHLPEAERSVAVERYLAQNRPGFLKRIFGGRPDTSSEEYLHQLSQDKLKLNDQVVQLLREQDAEGMPKAASKTAARTRQESFDRLLQEPLKDIPFDYVIGAHLERNLVLHALIDRKTRAMAAQMALEQSEKGSRPLHLQSFVVKAPYRGTGLGRRLWTETKFDNPGKSILAYPDPIDDKALNKEELSKVYQALGFKKSPIHEGLHYINTPKRKTAAEHAPQETSHLRDYALHSALNAGQAARDVRYLFDHPSADKIAPRDSALHSLSSLTARLPNLTSNLYYTALPPQLHHTPEELAEHRDASLKQMFLHGYAPWDNALPESKTADEHAPGIPDRHYHAALPDIKKPLTWKMSLQEHHADRAGHHYDLRLIDPETGHAHSWALPAAHMPEPGKSVLALQQPTHTSEYALNFGKDKEQEITKGYGKGRVKIKALDEIEIYHSKPEATGTRVRFNIYKSTGPEEYAIVNTGPGKDRLVNKTYHKGRLEHLDLGTKPKTKELGLDAIDFKNNDEVMMPKYDGAHTLLDLGTEGKIPRLFSYRTPKRHTAGVIEHTHKVPSLLEMRVPKELKGTLLRTETIGVDSKGKAVPAKDIAGMLNATVPNSRARQTELGTTLKPIILDVERYKGKSVQHLPFKERYELAKSIGQQLNLDVTDAAYDAKTKQKLLKLIGKGKHLLTTEGVVLRPLHVTGSPTKAKFRPDHDVHVREIFGATSKDGTPLDRAGGFRYSHTAKGPIVGSIGTGFDHALLKDMLSNPHNYTGRVAKVQAEQKYESGALGKASFIEWHLDKGNQI